MPRQAAAAAGFATGTNGDPDAVEAARGSRPIESETSLDLIMGAPPHHFVPSDIPLLACLCEGHRRRTDRSR